MRSTPPTRWHQSVVKGVQRSFSVFYNQIIPFSLIVFGILGVWVAARSLEPSIFDRLIRLTSIPIHEDSPVHLALLDDVSIDKLTKTYGPPPWKQTTYQDIAEKLERFKPAAIAFDTPYRSKNTLEDSKRTNASAARPITFIQSLPKGHQALGGDDSLQQNHFAIRDLTPTLSDGVVRSIKPYWAIQSQHQDYGGIYPSLTIASVFDALHYSNQDKANNQWVVSSSPTRSLNRLETLRFQQLGDQGQSMEIPLGNQGRLILRPYQAIGQTYDSQAIYSHMATPLWRLLEPSVDKRFKQKLHHKVLLIGSDSSLYQDTYPSSLGSKHLGIDLHATAIDNLLFNHVLTRSPDWERALWLLGAFLGALLLRVRLVSFGRTVLYTAAFMVLYFWYSLYCLVVQHKIVDVLTPEVFMLAGVIIGTLWWASQRNRQYLSLEKTLSQLVAPSVLREIQRSKDSLEASGQRIQITSLFVDIRDFTRLAENLPAMEVTDLLNAFYAEVERTVFEFEGTVDKYMGDGVLVMFGAPLAMADHADRALATAKRLDDRLQTLAKRWDDTRHIRFQVGISINSGYAYVGFLGPSNKLEYTAVGDTVNLCVRLQEQNKQFGVQTIFSEHTLALVQDEKWQTKAKPLGEVTVRGREAGLVVYSLKNS